MNLILLSLALAGSVSWGAENGSQPKTVPHVDLSRYSGTWYEIARFPFKQQNGCFNTTATYSLNPDGTIKVTNRCRKGGFDGPLSTAIAKAKVADGGSNAKLKVKFFLLAPWADYWIVQLGSDYDYAVVSQPERKYLWILSRTPTMDAQRYGDIVRRLEGDHFDVQRLEKTPHQWPDPRGNSSNFLSLIAPYFQSLLLVLAGMTLIWGLSLLLKDASLVDRFWGLGFVGLSLQQLWQNQFLTFRAALILILVLLWGLRLSVYIHFRNRGKPEDVRYQQMRDQRGKNFWWQSYFTVFLLQAILLWIISAPLAVIHLFPQPDVPTLLDVIGVILWVTGFLFESVADYQLSRFKKVPENRGRVCRIGVWNLSRHPNYFGESLIWWGYFLIAANVDFGWVTVFSPVLMTFLLLKVSGVALLEKQLHSTKPGYAEYVAEVPAFVPFWGRGSGKRGKGL